MTLLKIRTSCESGARAWRSGLESCPCTNSSKSHPLPDWLTITGRFCCQSDAVTILSCLPHVSSQGCLIPKAAQSFFSTPQFKPQQWTQYPAASNYVLWTVEQIDICSSAPALGKELFAELCGRAEDGNCFSCCSEICLYWQVRILCLEFHSTSGKSCPQNGCFNSLGFTHSLDYK